MYVCKKAAETTFVRNIRTYNVDEIDTWTQLEKLSSLFRVKPTGYASVQVRVDPDKERLDKNPNF